MPFHDLYATWANVDTLSSPHLLACHARCKHSIVRQFPLPDFDESQEQDTLLSELLQCRASLTEVWPCHPAFVSRLLRLALCTVVTNRPWELWPGPRRRATRELKTTSTTGMAIDLVCIRTVRPNIANIALFVLALIGRTLAELQHQIAVENNRCQLLRRRLEDLGRTRLGCS